MTRQSFIEDIIDFDELISFCSEYGCEICDEVYSEDSRDECVEEALPDMAISNTWRELRDKLGGIPTGYDWYRREYGYDEWVGLDDCDFDDYKDEVLDWADRNAVWDDEDDDEIDVSFDPEDDDDFVVEEEPISIGELMSMCSGQLRTIGDDRQAEEKADNEAFGVFVASCVTIVEVE